MTEQPIATKRLEKKSGQFDKFKKLAEEVGCEPNDAAFEKTLKRLAETPPPATVEGRKDLRRKKTE